MGVPLRVTLDADSAGPVRRANMMIACARRQVEVRHTSVTDTEADGTPFATRQQAILEIITNGSFPGDGRAADESERHHLRDAAMIFEAHCREGRDIFVSDDEKAFISHGRREKLEAVGNTRIMRTDEFCSWLVNWDG